MTPASSPPRRRRSRLRRILPVLAVLACAVVGCAVLGARGADARPGAAAVSTAAARPADGGTPPSGSGGRAPGAGIAGHGREVFLRDCAWCHGDHGQGTSDGPSLLGAGTADADFWLRTGRMPLKAPDDRPERGPAAYSPSTISEVVDYVGSLGAGEPVPELQPGDVATGQELFVAHCAACHSSSGTGMILPDGTFAPHLYDTAPLQVAEAVRLGPGQMPPFGEGELDQEQLDDVVSYVGTLGPQQVEGGTALDQIGPIAEGTFAWFVLLPLLLVVARLLGKKAPRGGS